MSVTIIYQGAALTFPDIDSPAEAYRRLGVNSSASSPSGGGASFNGNNIPKGIDPSLLRENNDWLNASRILYEGTQGKKWEGSQKDLAEWGLDRMARFNYNLMYSGIDAVGIKNAPDDQKKAFLFLMDNFDKVAYSWGGVGNFLEYVFKDPTTYVGLSTLGIGTAAARGAGFATKEGIKAALKTGAFGAVEGSLFGAAQSTIEQSARVNAGGQDSMNAGSIALSTLIGGAAGGVLSAGIAGAINRGGRTAANAAGEAVDPPPGVAATQVAQEAPGLPTPSTGPSTQLGLNLGDMNDPVQASQVRMQRAADEGRIGVTEEASQPSLMPFLWDQRRTDVVPDSQLRPAYNQETISGMSDRLMEKWGVDHQLKMDLPDAPSGPFAYDGQGRLFDMPEQVNSVQRELNDIARTRETLDRLEGSAFRDQKVDAAVRRELDNRELALDTRRYEEAMKTKQKIDEAVDQSLGPKELRQTAAKVEKETPFTPDMQFGRENGPNLVELLRTLRDIGSKVDAEAIRAFKRLSSVSDPLRRALLNMSETEAERIVRELLASSMTVAERKAFARATLDASNFLGNYIRETLNEADNAVTPFLKEQARDRALELEKILNPLRMLARQPASEAGFNLRGQQDSMFKGKKFRLEVDDILRDVLKIDPTKATPDERANALQMLVDSVISLPEKVEADRRVVDLRKKISDAVDEDEIIKLWDEMALLRQQIADEERAANSVIQNGLSTWKRVAGDVGSYAAMTVLGPSSVVVNTVSNALRTYTRPFLNYLTKGPLEEAAFKEMLATYGAMRSVASRSLRLGKEALDLESSILTGTESKWLEGQITRYGQEGQNNVTRFLGRNVVRIWMRLLNATDEVFGQMAYQGHVEGTAVYKALKEAQEKGLSKTDTDLLVKKSVEDALIKAYNTKPDASVYGMLREAGIKKGYEGEELRMWIKNQVQNNKDLYRRAVDEEGIAYHNDLLFKTEFSGDNTASSMAKGYEMIIQRHPELRLAGQLFFRTPVRVFEVGVRMTPIMQAFAPKFLADAFGSNGTARMIRARGELIASYGFVMAVMTAYATGKITGDGYGLDYREKRALENQGWRPYSIKVGDTWISYRSYDPFSTPMKIIVNALERLQMMDYQKAQGVFEQKGLTKEFLGYFGVAAGSTIQAIRDANLTAGIGDLVKLGEALADPDSNEKTFQQLFASKAALAVPNFIRKGIKSFGEDQNVSNDPMTVDQALTSIINPSSDRVTHQFDALGFKRTNINQGTLAYLGLELVGKESRERGLSEKDIYSLSEIAKMTYATGKRFIPTVKSPLYPDKDLREVLTDNGQMTVYNKAMEVFNKNMPAFAYDYLKASEDIPAGRRGELAQRAKGFETLQQRIWNAALQEVLYNDQLAQQQRMKKQTNKIDVLLGTREVAPSF